jgi:hypothetical protein
VPTKSVETVETVGQLVESAWLAVLDGQARCVVEWAALWSDGTVLRPSPDGLVRAPATTPEKLARVIRALGRPAGTAADADDPLKDWIPPDRLRPGAVCPRRDRLLKNGRWFVTDGQRVRSLSGGDASMSHMHVVARCLPVGPAFVATGEKVVFWDPPLASVEELASEAWLAVCDEQVHRVVTTAADIDRDGRRWVSIGHRYARREFRAISTGDTHLLALTHDQLLDRLRALSGRGEESQLLRRRSRPPFCEGGKPGGTPRGSKRVTRSDTKPSKSSDTASYLAPSRWT